MLYVLDEPSIGLHQRDNHRLIETLLRLRDLGNTVIVVEHDEDTIRAADYVVDIGPGRASTAARSWSSGSGRRPAGQRGVAHRRSTCPGASRSRCPASAGSEPRAASSTVRGRARAQPPERRRGLPARLLRRGHRRVGLGQVDAGQRHPATRRWPSSYNGARTCRAGTAGSRACEHLDKVVDVDQSPIGRTPRSNPATYTGVFDHIRKLFAQTTEAKVRGYQPGRFSFNVKGGRCEACAGDGTIKIEMHFLPDVYVPCEVCKGARYNRDTLEITSRARTSPRCSTCRCEEAAEFFANQPADRPPHADPGRRRSRLRAAGPARPDAVRRRGAAGQAGLRAAARGRPAGRSTCSTSRPPGCTSRTSASCSAVLGRLVDQGNTVIVIEHNLDVIKTADWIIDLGPEGRRAEGSRRTHSLLQLALEALRPCRPRGTPRFRQGKTQNLLRGRGGRAADLFNDVLEHVLRIDRSFRQPQGHLILIGVSGSGKTTLSRFVAWMNGLKVFQIKVHGKYSAEDFDEDLREAVVSTVRKWKKSISSRSVNMTTAVIALKKATSLARRPAWKALGAHYKQIRAPTRKLFAGRSQAWRAFQPRGRGPVL